jgi:hypothetical protein
LIYNPNIDKNKHLNEKYGNEFNELHNNKDKDESIIIYNNEETENIIKNKIEKDRIEKDKIEKERQKYIKIKEKDKKRKNA